ncbi:unannotated protein [freshwater metagenome]|uniref:Unannotated protein n=1 Tax=freshwater metagenome TaxID=449393 RepID=A0A6J7LRL5_9ZZZZ
MNFKTLRNSRGWIFVLATVVGLSFGGYTFVHRALTSHVYVTNCGVIDYKPTVVIKFCADAGVLISQVEWSSWSTDSATGSGVYEINDCQPTCVAGKSHYADVEIVLSKLKNISGKSAFTFIKIKTKDSKNLPLSQSSEDAWPLELAG